MPSIGIFFGSQTGNTERIAGLIAEQLADLDPKVINIAEANEETVLSYDVIMIGIPTWNIGELQEHWEEFHPKMSGMNWKGKTIAIFGLGDNQGYPDTYQDGMGILAEPILAGGGKIIGFTPTDGYEFDGSRAVIDGKFCGLCLDEDNEAEKTEDRVKNWCAQLRVELGLAKAPEAQAAAEEPKKEEAQAPAQAEAKEEPKPEAPKPEPKKEASQAEAPKAGAERTEEAKKEEAKPAEDVKKADAPAAAAQPNEKDEKKEEAQPAAAKPEEKKEEAKPAAAAKPAAKPAAPAAKPGAAAAKPAPKKPAPADLPPPPQLTTRRTFLEWGTAAWVLFFVWLGGIFHLFGRFMFPRVLYEKDPRFRAGKKSDFPEVNKVYELFKESQAVWLVRLLEDGEDHLVALSTVCTHLGCTPNWLDAENKFKCPCHGSGFYKSGVNFEGPAPRPLERYRIFVDAAGDVVVDKARKFREDLAQWGDPDSFVKMS